MIKKKKCNNCEEKIKGNPNFCPACGIQLEQITQDWGILGKNDLSKKTEEPKMFGGLTSGIMNKMIGSAMHMLEKEIQKNMNEQSKTQNPKIRLMINGKEITPQEKQTKKDSDTKFLPIDFSSENLKKYKSLKKIEPKSSLKRIEDKIKYEIEIPEVNSIKDISIIKLENSIEVKAVGKDKGYLKTIPIDLPLKKYSLLKGILTLELDTAH